MTVSFKVWFHFASYVKGKQYYLSVDYSLGKFMNLIKESAKSHGKVVCEIKFMKGMLLPLR